MELPVVGNKSQGSYPKKEIVLARDCDATIIPSGEKLRLVQGDIVFLTQALGGSVTVRTECGYLVRIASADADAIGLDIPQGTLPQQSQEVPAEQGPFDIQHVFAQLATVFDPEIPVNVVDLGLIYLCEATEIEGGGHRVKIEMSMTAPGCGMGDVLRVDARDRVLTIPGVTEVDVQIVWDPPWDRSRMSEAARLQLGML